LESELLDKELSGFFDGPPKVKKLEKRKIVNINRTFGARLSYEVIDDDQITQICK
jgi:hypothetical protein